MPQRAGEISGRKPQGAGKISGRASERGRLNPERTEIIFYFPIIRHADYDNLRNFLYSAKGLVAGLGRFREAEVVVLCCLSERYFRKRLEALGCRPLLMTSQLMYPGSFLLSAAIESWRQGGDVGDVRAAAGSAYAKNQKIATKAATGVFADLKRQSPADSGD